MKELNGLYLNKVMDNNWGLHLVNESVKNYITLKEEVYGLLKPLNPFIQSDSDPMRQLWEQIIDLEDNKEFDHSYLFIEFWTDNQELMLNLSMQFASMIGLELKMEDF